MEYNDTYKYCQNSQCESEQETFSLKKMFLWETFVFCSNKCKNEFVKRFKERKIGEDYA